MNGIFNRTDAQNKFYWKLIETLGLSEDDRIALNKAVTEKEHTSAMNRVQMKRLLSDLKRKAKGLIETKVKGGAFFTQIRMIKNLAGQMGWDEKRILAFIESQTRMKLTFIDAGVRKEKLVHQGKCEFEYLTLHEASNIIEAMKAMIERKNATAEDAKGAENTEKKC